MTNSDAPLTFGSLFAGIGGIDLGLERAGFRCAWQVEINDYAQAVLQKHWPDVPKFRDIRECGAHNLEPVDMIAGGFPCQDISVAGKGKGIIGERSGLWFEFARIIRDLRPRFVFVENVAAILVRGLDAVLGSLAALGYDAEWDCVPAAAVGAPTRRDRFFLVAYAARLRLPSVGAFNYTHRHHARWGVPDRRSACDECSRRRLGWPYDPATFVEPWLLRGNARVPRRVDRLRCLGNAVVPQVVEPIARRLAEVINGRE